MELSIVTWLGWSATITSIHRYFSSSQTETLHLVNNCFPLLPASWEPPSDILSLCIWLFLVLPVCGVLPYLSFSVWLISLSIIVLLIMRCICKLSWQRETRRIYPQVHLCSLKLFWEWLQKGRQLRAVHSLHKWSISLGAALFIFSSLLLKRYT